MRASSTWSRPAVSRTMTSRPDWRAWATASVAMSHDRGSRRRAVDRDVESSTKRHELLDRRGPIGVRGHEQGLATLAHDPARQLGRRRRLARALQADHGDDRRRAAVAERPVARAEDGRQLLVDDLHDHLAGVRVLDDLAAHGALADPGDELLHDLVVDVGFEEREAHLAHRDVDIGLGDAAAAGEVGEGQPEAIGQGVEHGGRQSIVEAARGPERSPSGRRRTEVCPGAGICRCRGSRRTEVCPGAMSPMFEAGSRAMTVHAQPQPRSPSTDTASEWHLRMRRVSPAERMAASVRTSVP